MTDMFKVASAADEIAAEVDTLIINGMPAVRVCEEAVKTHSAAYCVEYGAFLLIRAADGSTARSIAQFK